MQVELKQDLASSCVVGDVVTVLGLVKVLATGEGAPGEWREEMDIAYDSSRKGCRSFC